MVLGGFRTSMRGFERALAAPFLWLRVPPNAITLLTLAPAAAATYFVSQQAWWWAFVWGGVASLFDVVDGTVARVTNRATPFGGFLDSVVDRVVDLMFLFGIGFALDSGVGWVVVGLGAVGSFGTSYARARAYEFVKPPAAAWQRGFERSERILTLAVALIALSVAERFPAWKTDATQTLLLSFMVVYAALSVATLMQRIWIARRLIEAAG